MLKLQIISLLFLLAIGASFANLPSPPQDKLAVLEAGELVLVSSREKSKETWPHVSMWKYVECEPRNCFLIFSDFEAHKTFVKDLVFSNTRYVSDTEIHVDFRLKVPWPIKKSDSTSGHYLKKIGDSYQVDWFFVRGDDTSDTKGFVNFRKVKGKTLMTYINHVTPNSVFAGLFSNRVVNDMRATVEAFDTRFKQLGTKKDYLDLVAKKLARTLKVIEK